MLGHADHPFVRENTTEIAALLAEATQGLRREENLSAIHRGRVQQVGEATYRVTYDFERPDQLVAFEGVGSDAGRAFEGRWQIGKGALESEERTSVMQWKPLVRGDVVVEYDLTALEEPQNIVLDLYYNRGKTEHYAVVLGFDWVGRSEGDRDNTIEDRFGMPRTCVLKYPVQAEKTLWTVETTWDGWKSRLVGGPEGAWKPPRGETVRIRVERKGASIVVSAGGAVVWKGEDDAYGEGRLLFFSDCKCRVDNLSITWTP
jgi:hypothetical protein